MNRPGFASHPSSSAASPSLLGSSGSSGAGGGAQRGPSNRSHCILACIFLFSVTSIVFAWSFLIYENLHPRAVTDSQLHADSTGLPGSSVITTSPVENTPPNGGDASRIVYERPKTEPDVVGKTPAPVLTLSKKSSAATASAFKYPTAIHFIHIPKCGGTSMSAVLRQLMCQVVLLVKPCLIYTCATDTRNKPRGLHEGSNYV